MEVDAAEGKLKLGLKQSFFVDEPEEQAEEGGSEDGNGELDLEEEMLDAVEVDSDAGGDWRTALESPDSTAASGEHSRGPHLASLQECQSRDVDTMRSHDFASLIGVTSRLDAYPIESLSSGHAWCCNRQPACFRWR